MKAQMILMRYLQMYLGPVLTARPVFDSAGFDRFIPPLSDGLRNDQSGNHYSTSKQR